ncbi:MAG: O-antigen ligase family protein [Chloroflexi bacterium]|nr:O-antigen ligase family protein [Chloroflexota bacterium]
MKRVRERLFWESLLDNRLQWLRLLIIIGSLFFSIVLPPLLSVNISLILMSLPVMIFGALAIIHRPPLGLLLLVAAGMLVPFRVPGLGLTAVLLFGLTALWLIDMVVRYHAIKIIKSSTFTPLLYFTVTIIVAFIMGQLPWFPIQPAPLDAQLGGIAIFILSFCAFLLVAHQIQDIHWLRKITYLFLSIAGLYIIGRFLEPIRRFNMQFFHPGTIGSLFWVWVVAISASQALINRQLHIRWRFALLSLTLATLYIGFFQANAWSSGWIPGFIAIFVIFLVSIPRLAIPVGLLGSFWALLSLQKLYDTIVLGDNAYSTLTRLEAWRIVIEIVKVNPVLGLGPANYRFYTALFPILGWSVQFNSHNNYVDIIAQTGLLGLIVFLWFLWEVGRLTWRLRLKVPADGFAQAYVYGCMGGWVGTIVAGMLGDWVLPFVYNVGIEGLRASVLFWLFLGGIVAIEQMVLQDTPLD